MVIEYWDTATSTDPTIAKCFELHVKLCAINVLFGVIYKVTLKMSVYLFSETQQKKKHPLTFNYFYFQLIS